MERLAMCWIVAGMWGSALAACSDSDRAMTVPMIGATGAGSSGTSAGPSAGASGTGAASAMAGRSAPPVAGEAAGAAGATVGSSGASAAGRPAAAAPAAGTPAAGVPAAGMAAGAGGMIGAAGGGGSAGSTTAMEMPSLPPVSDYAAKGPFTTTTTSNTGPGNAYTIFRPEPLGENGFAHPPLIFGPGIITSPSQYRTLLDHLASHGFVTICVNSLTGGPNAPGNLEAMHTGLEWLIEQNGQSGPFEGKLAVERAITMGYSIGATASVQLSSHAAIVTTVAIHGHATEGDPRGPVLLLTGTSDVIDDVRETLATVEEAPAMLAALPIGHLNVLSELAASGRYIAPITAWLRYWVHRDEAARRYFWGPDCTMCTPPWIEPEVNAKWSAQML